MAEGAGRWAQADFLSWSLRLGNHCWGVGVHNLTDRGGFGDYVTEFMCKAIKCHHVYLEATFKRKYQEEDAKLQAKKCRRYV